MKLPSSKNLRFNHLKQSSWPERFLSGQKAKHLGFSGVGANSMGLSLQHWNKGTEHKPIQVWTDGSLNIWFGDMHTKLPFSDELKRSEFLRRLNEIPGITIPDKAIDKYPSISLSTLNSEIAREQFRETLDWFVQEVEAT